MSPGARDVLAAIACISMLGAALVAFGQVDLKRLLAYSTISQVGLHAGRAGHRAGARRRRRPRRSPTCSPTPASRPCSSWRPGRSRLVSGTTLLSGLSGGWRRTPLVAACFTLGLAALAGLPPLSGFWSKEAILGSAEARDAARRPAGGRGGSCWSSASSPAVVTAAYATRAWLLVVPARPAVQAADEAEAAELAAESRPADGGLSPTSSGCTVPDAMRWPLRRAGGADRLRRAGSRPAR